VILRKKIYGLLFALSGFTALGAYVSDLRGPFVGIPLVLCLIFWWKFNEQ
jgi:hypothetical protein